MNFYHYNDKKLNETTELPEDLNQSGEFLIMCRPHEVALLQDKLGFDESTVRDCMDLDESVRYASFDGYDFVSLVYLIELDGVFNLEEINLYIAQSYLVMVLPEHASERVLRLEQTVLAAAKNAIDKGNRINRLYYAIWHGILSDFSDLLEGIEDYIEALSSAITKSVRESQFEEIHRLRKMTYAAKKQLRALSYLGEQLLVDENGLIDKKQNKYFRTVDTRLKKLYDFAANLYDLSSELLYTYDSKLSMKTNDIVTKLTIITLFFGPLTVATGIYGMNFTHMPELSWRYGYPAVLIGMLLIVVILYAVLKKKRWL